MDKKSITTVFLIFSFLWAAHPLEWDNLPDLSDMDANTPPATEGI